MNRVIHDTFTVERMLDATPERVFEALEARRTGREAGDRR